MKTKTRIICALLAAAMLLIFSSCGGDTTWIAQYDETKLPSGVYLCYLFNEYVNASYEVEDYTKSVLSQEIDGKDAKSWIVEKTADDLRRYVAVEQEFKRLELSLSESDLSAVDNLTASQWAYYGDLYTRNGISQDSFKLVVKNSYETSLIFNKYYGKDGLEAVPESELKDIYKKNYIKARYMLFRKLDDSGSALSDDLLTEYRERAAKMIQSAQKGEDFNKLIIENEIKLLKDNGQTEDQLSHTHDSDDAHDLLINTEETALPEKFVSTIKGMQLGDLKSFEDETYLYAAQRLDINEKAEDFDSVSAEILSDYKGDEFEEKLQEMAKNVQVSFNESALKRYTPDRIKED